MPCKLAIVKCCNSFLYMRFSPVRDAVKLKNLQDGVAQHKGGGVRVKLTPRRLGGGPIYLYRAPHQMFLQ